MVFIKRRHVIRERAMSSNSLPCKYLNWLFLMGLFFNVAAVYQLTLDSNDVCPSPISAMPYTHTYARTHTYKAAHSTSMLYFLAPLQRSGWANERGPLWGVYYILSIIAICVLKLSSLWVKGWMIYHLELHLTEVAQLCSDDKNI